MQKNLPLYLAGKLAPPSKLVARLHLRSCSSCFAAYERSENATNWTARLNPVRPPANLRLQIRLELTREIAREGWLRRRWGQFKSDVREALQPVVIRSAGGLAAAILLFGVLMPDIWTQPVHASNDIPLRLLNHAVAVPAVVTELGPYAVDGNVTVLAFIDVRGGVYDLELPAELSKDDKLRAQIANALLFTQFEPATLFGRPVPGFVLINFTNFTVKG
ncbi:MAG: zf-HC2 domain-containing protein [Bryobacterales bacterium]